MGPARGMEKWPVLSFGVHIAKRGATGVVSVAVCILTVAGTIALAVALAGHRDAPLHDLPILASGALAWGGGFLHAFGASLQALERDRSDGVRELLLARTTRESDYLLARVGGLALFLAAVVGGGTLVTGLVAWFSGGAFGATLQSTVASLAFSLAFAGVVAPVALAALGSRSRAGGYVALLFVLVFPEAMAILLAGVIPDAVRELLAIPAALQALRGALAPGSADLGRAIRALLALGVFAAIAVRVVAADAKRLAEQARGDA